MDYIKKGRNMKLSELLEVTEDYDRISVLLIGTQTELYEGSAEKCTVRGEDYKVEYQTVCSNEIFIGVRRV